MLTTLLPDGQPAKAQLAVAVDAVAAQCRYVLAIHVPVLVALVKPHLELGRNARYVAAGDAACLGRLELRRAHEEHQPGQG